MPPRLTKEEINKRIKHKNIEMVGDYTNGSIHTEWLCLNDNHKWMTSSVSIKNGSGCPKCSGRTVKDEQSLDEKVKEKGLKVSRIGNYVNSKTKIEWKCDNNHTWFSNSNNILRGKGCPHCAKRPPVDNSVVDERLKHRNILRIGDYKNALSKILWKCLNDGCGHEWKATPNNILSKGSGCPNCLLKNENLVYSLLINNFRFDKFERHKRLQFNNRNYYVDFYFVIDKQKYVVEYNGRQHYEPVKFFGGEEKFKEQTKRDLELVDYCESKNIKLIQMSYKLKTEEQKLSFLKNNMKFLVLTEKDLK